MTTYVYETIPQQPDDVPERFELQQPMTEPALTQHPRTGQPVRRVIAGGYGFIAQKSAPPPPPCGGQCGCCCEN